MMVCPGRFELPTSGLGIQYTLMGQVLVRYNFFEINSYYRFQSFGSFHLVLSSLGSFQ